MSQKQNKFDFQSEETKKKYLNAIIGFFRDERNETIGIIAAEEILTFFLRIMGEEIYGKAIHDCKNLLKERMLDLEVDFDSLSST